MLLCLQLSVSSAIAPIAVPVCSVFYNKLLTVDAVVLFVFKTCAALVVCVFVCMDGAETLSLINVAWRGVAWHGFTRCAVCSFIGCCPVFVEITVQLYPESVSLAREYF
jgi:hypothetical protein